MEFFETTEGILFAALAGLIIGCIILYNVIKAAIKDAFKEMKKAETPATPPAKPIPAPNWTKKQIELQTKFEKGEITLEEYTKEWNKL